MPWHTPTGVAESMKIWLGKNINQSKESNSFGVLVNGSIVSGQNLFTEMIRTTTALVFKKFSLAAIKKKEISKPKQKNTKELKKKKLANIPQTSQVVPPPLPY